MKILMVGSGKGSWTIRGVQLGGALGARITSTPSEKDFVWADVVVLVKHAGAQWAKAVHRLGKPLVWDAVDCWRQPTQHRMTEGEAKAWLRGLVSQIRPTLTIGATVQMATDCDGVCLPHHGWIGLQPTPAKKDIAIVGYEGNPSYLGTWAGALTKACQERGWTFAINPPDLRTVDLFVSFREGQWDGWICRAWKSGVKVVNAICAGRPILTQATASALELVPAGTVIETTAELPKALDAWAEWPMRKRVVDACQSRAQDFRLETIARRYYDLLEQVTTCAH